MVFVFGGGGGEVVGVNAGCGEERSRLPSNAILASD